MKKDKVVITAISRCEIDFGWSFNVSFNGILVYGWMDFGGDEVRLFGRVGNVQFAIPYELMGNVVKKVREWIAFEYRSATVNIEVQ